MDEYVVVNEAVEEKKEIKKNDDIFEKAKKFIWENKFTIGISIASGYLMYRLGMKAGFDAGVYKGKMHEWERFNNYLENVFPEEDMLYTAMREKSDGINYISSIQATLIDKGTIIDLLNAKKEN